MSKKLYKLKPGTYIDPEEVSTIQHVSSRLSAGKYERSHDIRVTLKGGLFFTVTLDGAQSEDQALEVVVRRLGIQTYVSEDLK